MVTGLPGSGPRAIVSWESERRASTGSCRPILDGHLAEMAARNPTLIYPNRKFVAKANREDLGHLGAGPGGHPLSKQDPVPRVEAARAEFELTGVNRTSPENFIRKIAGFPKDYLP
jgi:hypothetical protein